MAIKQWGLLFNLIGSLLLGCGILDKKILLSFETKIKQFPDKIIEWLFILTLQIFLKAAERKDKPWQSNRQKRWIKEVERYITISYSNEIKTV